MNRTAVFSLVIAVGNIRKPQSGSGFVSSYLDLSLIHIFPIIRFAEMLLFRAEAYLMKNQPDKAWKDLNRIHVRACGLSLPSPATMEQLYHCLLYTSAHTSPERAFRA